MKAPTPAEWQTWRARAVTRIAAAETELASAHALLERCDTALEGLGFGASMASANVHRFDPQPGEVWVNTEPGRCYPEDRYRVETAGPDVVVFRNTRNEENTYHVGRKSGCLHHWRRADSDPDSSDPDSLLEVARRAGASHPRLVRSPEGLRLTIGPVDDPVAIGRALLEREPVGHPWTFRGSRQVLIYPGVSFRFERWQGEQVPLGLLPPLSSVEIKAWVSSWSPWMGRNLRTGPAGRAPGASGEDAGCVERRDAAAPRVHTVGAVLAAERRRDLTLYGEHVRVVGPSLRP